MEARGGVQGGRHEWAWGYGGGEDAQRRFVLLLRLPSVHRDKPGYTREPCGSTGMTYPGQGRAGWRDHAPGRCGGCMHAPTAPLPQLRPS